MKRKTVLIIIIVGLAAVFGTAGFVLLSHEGGSLTVSESKALAASPDRLLSIEGKVAPGSVVWDSRAELMKFVLTDGREDIEVVYQGVVPDHFKVGSALTVSGKYRPDGVLEASLLSSGQKRSLCAVCH
ncbi:MAG: cytochrome c maturation protein CcmE [Chloroflexota bacterium]